AALDHVVWMRRLPADRLLPALLARGAVSDAMMEALAARMAAFHAAAPAGAEEAAEADPARPGPQRRGNPATVAPFTATFLSTQDYALLDDFGPGFVRTHATLLAARVRAGRVRDGHGDLHAEHVCFLDAPVASPDHPPLAPGIYVFDCIEFAPAFRRGDVAAEVAFLTMDLEHRGHAALARRFADAYAEAAGAPDLHLLLPLYACARACVRGKVDGLTAAAADVDADGRAAAADRARRYFALALRYAWSAG